jgi:hypothetical protein
MHFDALRDEAVVCMPRGTGPLPIPRSRLAVELLKSLWAKPGQLSDSACHGGEGFGVPHLLSGLYSDPHWFASSVPPVIDAVSDFDQPTGHGL